jgi:hypothetical protein
VHPPPQHLVMEQLPMSGPAAIHPNLHGMDAMQPSHGRWGAQLVSYQASSLWCCLTE